jgi:hypothetical protein
LLEMCKVKTTPDLRRLGVETDRAAADRMST